MQYMQTILFYGLEIPSMEQKDFDKEGRSNEVVRVKIVTMRKVFTLPLHAMKNNLKKP